MNKKKLIFVLLIILIISCKPYIQPVCNECQYLENNRCIDYECCNNEDCNKEEICLENRCKKKSKEGIPIIEHKGNSPFSVILKFIDDCGDNYDFVTIYTDFEHKKYTYHKYYSFDKYYPVSKLRGYNVMGNINDLIWNLKKFGISSVNGISHETGHNWCCYIKFKDWNGEESNDWLQGGIHWHDQLLDVGTNDPMGGRYKWKDNGDGTFTSSSIAYENETYRHFSNLTLYLMGLIEKDEVEPVKLIVPETKITKGNYKKTIKGKMYEITVDDIILDDHYYKYKLNSSETNLKMIFVLWTRDKNNITDEQLNEIKRIRELFEEQWFESTRGLSTMDTNLN